MDTTEHPRAVTPTTPPGTLVRWTGNRGTWQIVGHDTSPTAGPVATIRAQGQATTRTRPLAELTLTKEPTP